MRQSDAQAIAEIRALTRPRGRLCSRCNREPAQRRQKLCVSCELDDEDRYLDAWKKGAEWDTQLPVERKESQDDFERDDARGKP